MTLTPDVSQAGHAAATARGAAIDAAVQIAAEHAEAVDREGRFPHEAVEALRAAKLLSAGLPVEVGGAAMTLREMAEITRRLGAACASTGMIYAMHQSQVGILGRHAIGTPTEPLVRRIAAEEWLIASATTEISTGGDIRNSTCAVEMVGDRVHVQKNAPVISYGAHAHAICITARRNAEAPSSDQVLVVCPIDDVAMEPTFPWNVMGFRGTCSPGFILDATTDAANVMAVDYATISQVTVLPVAHVLWASDWLGIADAAVDKTRVEIRKAARRMEGTPPTAARLTDVLLEHQTFEGAIEDALARFERFEASGEESPTVGFTIAMNNLKRIASQSVIDVVTQCLAVVGINGYREDHPASMARLLRDAFGPQLMVSNERIRQNTADLVLAWRR